MMRLHHQKQKYTHRHNIFLKIAILHWCCFSFANSFSIVPTTPRLQLHHQNHHRCERLAQQHQGRRTRRTFHNALAFDHQEDNETNQKDDTKKNRRNFLQSATTIATSLLAVSPLQSSSSTTAHARGLIQFPCRDYQFLNTYHFLRVGESLLEEEGVWSTNPLFLTNREAALSAKGVEQIQQTSQMLKEEGVNPTIIRYSLAAAAMDTVDIVGKELKVGRDRLVPEFNFMDPRAVGQWDMLPLETTQEAVWAMDADEAGNDGMKGRPPPNEDGTPNEILADQTVRLRQLLSVLETQYSGDTVLLIFPDGTGPALLTCLIGGIPLNRVHELEYKPGEVRLNVNYKTAQQQIQSQEVSEEYMKKLEVGREQLKILRQNPEDILNVRDQAYVDELRREDERKAEAKLVAREKELMEKTRKQELEKEKQLAAKAQRMEMERESATKKKVSEENNRQIQSVDDAAEDTNTAAVIAGVSVIATGTVASLFTSEDNDSKTDTITEKKTLEGSPVKSPAELKAPDAFDGKSELELTKLPLQGSSQENIVQDETNSDEKVTQIDSKDDLHESESKKDIDSNTLMKEVQPIIIPTTTTSFSKPAPAWDPDEDDGAEAWLGSLTEMLEEE